MRRSALAGFAAALPDWERYFANYHLLAGGSSDVGDGIQAGAVALDESSLAVGSVVDLTGRWLFKPSYAVRSGERPEAADGADGYVEVPVPQLLNRIRWWLDDSQDFDRWEQARLDRLGFDTERSDEGWYRLYVDTPALPDDRHVFLHFDGVAMISQVYLNGERLGDHAGMFSRFGYDLTPHLRPGRNVLAVYVSMERIPPSEISLGEAVTVNLTASKVMTMSKGMYGPLSPNNDNRAYDLYGIWQPVRLVVRGPAMIDDAWFIPALDRAEVRVESHALGAPKSGVLEAVWTDRATGERLASTGPRRIRLGSDVATETLAVSGLSPKHWTPADPHLYRMEVTLKGEDGALLDRVTHDVGFRTFEVKGNQLLLNGRPYWLRGANHLPYGKNPWDADLPKKLITLMHEGNQRVTRTHCTPWNETWLRAADEIGLGVSIEGIRPWAFVGKIGGPPPEIYAHWLMEHEDVVRRCRNHPSVLIWTIGNEMMLRDGANLEKWKLLSGAVELTRRLDPTRPIVCSSDYERDPAFYREVLAPNGIDDGDIDDIHRYYGWYGDSNFVQDSLFEEELEKNKGLRPLIGQEMSTGYPDLDSGLPVLRYTRDLAVPQAWVGPYAYPGHNPSIWLNEHRDTTKRWAEQLRFQRTGRTAGFMLFANECWYHHSFDPETVHPYPVHEGVRYAWSPVGLALKTPRRRFYAGEVLATSIFVTNDDEQFRDHTDLVLSVSFVGADGRTLHPSVEVGRLGRIAYYEVAEIPARIVLPDVPERQSVQVVTRLLRGTEEVSRTVDYVDVFRPDRVTGTESHATAVLLSAGSELERFVEGADVFGRIVRNASGAPGGPAVVLLGRASSLDLLQPGRWVYEWLRTGGTAVVFSPGVRIGELFPEHIDLVREDIGEYADPSPAAGTRLVERLGPMDLKWWGRRGEDRAFISAVHHRLRKDGEGRTLIRFIPSHGYVRESEVPGLYRSLLSEIPVGRGRLWVCDFDFEASVGLDPAADLFARNLLLAAADPNSTDRLVTLPTHEQLLNGHGSALR